MMPTAPRAISIVRSDDSAARQAPQLRVPTRQPDGESSVLIYAIYLVSNRELWQAELIPRAPAEHAAIARDRNGVAYAGRDRNNLFIPEGFQAFRRKLSQSVAVS